jgi:hypothetical protein
VLKTEAPGVTEFRGSSTELSREEKRKAAAYYALTAIKKHCG